MSLRPVYLGFGIFFTSAGIVGAFLPIIPTTPFLLLALFFFSKSSPRFEAYLLNHPKLGPGLRDWKSSRVIRREKKVYAIIAIILSFAFSIYSVSLGWLKIMLLVIGLCLCFFIGSRKESVTDER